MSIKFGWRHPAQEGRTHYGHASSPSGSISGLPASVILGNLPEVYDQGRVGSCTAQALAAAMEILAPHAGYPVERPSRPALYWRERWALRETQVDEGAIIADGVSALKVGWEKETWHDPSGWSTAWTLPPEPVGPAAPRLVNAQAITFDPATVGWELSVGSPVAIGLQVTRDWLDLVGDTLPPAGGDVIGGHALLLVGYERDRGELIYRVRNSWSSSWGDGGYAWLPASWLEMPWCGEAHALRAIRRAE